jgi:hypothetical protein
VENGLTVFEGRINRADKEEEEARNALEHKAFSAGSYFYYGN